MSNGDTDLKHLRNGSRTRLRLVTSHGHLVTSSSLHSARHAQQPTAARTSYSSEHCQYQKKSSVNALRLAQKRAKAFLDYSMKDLATMDSQGIKLLGVEFEYDYSDRSWAE